MVEDIPFTLRKDVPLGAKIRYLRKKAHLSGHALAERADTSQSTISRIETGQLLPSPEVVAIIARALHASPEVREELIRDAARSLESHVSWTTLHSDGLASKQMAIRELEDRASLIGVFQNALVPGLLQVPEYSRHVLELANVSKQDDVSGAVAARIERQQALYRDDKQFEFLVMEYALRNEICPRKTLIVQLQWLSTIVSELDNVTLGIVPRSAILHAIPLNAYVLLNNERVVIEGISGEDRIEEGSPQVGWYIENFEALRKSGVYGDDAIKLLKGLMDNLS